MAFQILITDDEDQFRHSLGLLLGEEGFSVDMAATGKEAFLHLQKKRYDVILLDLGLPDLTGIDIAEFILDKYPNSGVVILTGQASVDSAIRAVQLGCYDYLTKPCHPRQVIRTVRRAAEHFKIKRELLASHKKFKMMAEATSEGIAILEGDRIVHVNSLFCSLFGIAKDQLEAISITELLPTLLHPSLAPDNYLGIQETSVEETEGIRFDGTILPVELRKRLIQIDSGNCQAISVRDLTHAIREQENKRALEEKLAYALRMESIGLMAGSVAHDLNNILSSVVTFPELLLLDMPDNSQYRKDIERIRKAGKKAAEVVADLLTIARGSTCAKKVIELNEIIEEYQQSLDFLDLETDSSQISFSFELSPTLPDIQISPLHVTKTLINLVHNAVEAIGRKSGKIRISTNLRELVSPFSGSETIPAGKYTVLSVADTGTGIEKSHLPHVFTPFYSKKQMGKSGSGLGLTIVMHTMKDHCGFINLESSREGTLFELFFPVHTGEKHQKKEPVELNLETLKGEGETILVIDDEESERLLAAAILTRLGYRPYMAGSGAEALEILRHHSMDLLLLDMVLASEMDGWEIYQKALKICPTQKVIVTSGHHNHPDREKLHAMGVSHYLNKPFRLSHLAQAIRREIATTGHKLD